MSIASVCPAAPVAELEQAAARYEIDSSLRMAHWLAQMAHESAGFTIKRENLNYSVEALLSLFGRHRISEAEAHRYGRSAEHPADQQAIANCLYGGEWGATALGNRRVGDGWLYIGRGFKQLTGRANYLNCGYGIDLDLISHPDLLESDSAAAMSAGWFWNSRGLNELADRDDLAGITKKVNGGTIGLAERGQWLRRFKAAL